MNLPFQSSPKRRKISLPRIGATLLSLLTSQIQVPPVVAQETGKERPSSESILKILQNRKMITPKEMGTVAPNVKKVELLLKEFEANEGDLARYLSGKDYIEVLLRNLKNPLFGKILDEFKLKFLHNPNNKEDHIAVRFVFTKIGEILTPENYDLVKRVVVDMGHIHWSLDISPLVDKRMIALYEGLNQEVNENKLLSNEEKTDFKRSVINSLVFYRKGFSQQEKSDTLFRVYEFATTYPEKFTLLLKYLDGDIFIREKGVNFMEDIGFEMLQLLTSDVVKKFSDPEYVKRFKKSFIYQYLMYRFLKPAENLSEYQSQVGTEDERKERDSRVKNLVYLKLILRANRAYESRTFEDTLMTLTDNAREGGNEIRRMVFSGDYVGNPSIDVEEAGDQKFLAEVLWQITRGTSNYLFSGLSRAESAKKLFGSLFAENGYKYEAKKTEPSFNIGLYKKVLFDPVLLGSYQDMIKEGGKDRFSEDVELLFTSWRDASVKDLGDALENFRKFSSVFSLSSDVLVESIVKELNELLIADEIYFSDFLDKVASGFPELGNKVVEEIDKLTASLNKENVLAQVRLSRIKSALR